MEYLLIFVYVIMGVGVYSIFDDKQPAPVAAIVLFGLWPVILLSMGARFLFTGKRANDHD